MQLTILLGLSEENNRITEIIQIVPEETIRDRDSTSVVSFVV